MNKDYLFRGVSSAIHESGNGLRPKSSASFSYGATYGEATYGAGWTYGDSEANAVLKHQLDQAGAPTSGLSTTPIYERAVFYALSGGRHDVGYVYRINRRVLASHGIREFVVSRVTNAPSVPEDREVVLVGAPGSPLPDTIVDRTTKVSASTAGIA